MNKTHKNTKRRGTLRKRNDNKSRKRCINTFVKTKMQRDNEFKKKYFDKREKHFRKIMEKKDISKEDKDTAKNALKQIEKERKAKSFIKSQQKIDAGLFCNPGCKGTFLEPGNKLTPEYYKKFKDNKELIKIFENDRKELFGDRTNVLIDDFYEKASTKFVEKLKKEGAISLCAPVKKYVWY
jgi:hypothetical protein